MSQVYSTPAILLRQIELVGGDRLGVFFTQQFGKRTILLQGVKKCAAKLQYRLKEGRLCEIEFVQGKRLPRLTGIYQVETRVDSSLYQLKLQWWLGHFLDSLIPDEGSSHEVFTFLNQILINRTVNTEREMYLNQQSIILRTMSLLGYELHCSACVVSGNTKSQHFLVSVRAGGLLIPKMKGHYPEAIRLTKIDIISIKRLQKGEYIQHLLPNNFLCQYSEWYGTPILI